MKADYKDDELAEKLNLSCNKDIYKQINREKDYTDYLKVYTFDRNYTKPTSV